MTQTDPTMNPEKAAARQKRYDRRQARPESPRRHRGRSPIPRRSARRTDRQALRELTAAAVVAV